MKNDLKIVPTRQIVEVVMKVYLPRDLPRFSSPEIAEDTVKYDALILERVNRQMDGAVEIVDVGKDEFGDYANVLMRKNFRIGAGWSFRHASK